jgi:hypothetical protein
MVRSTRSSTTKSLKGEALIEGNEANVVTIEEDAKVSASVKSAPKKAATRKAKVIAPQKRATSAAKNDKRDISANEQTLSELDVSTNNSDGIVYIEASKE